MNRLLRIKLTLAVAGVLVLIWGLRTDNATLRWIAIAILAVSVLMRFIPRRLRSDDYPRPPETG